MFLRVVSFSLFLILSVSAGVCFGNDNPWKNLVGCYQGSYLDGVGTRVYVAATIGYANNMSVDGLPAQSGINLTISDSIYTSPGSIKPWSTSTHDYLALTESGTFRRDTFHGVEGLLYKGCGRVFEASYLYNTYGPVFDSIFVSDSAFSGELIVWARRIVPQHTGMNTQDGLDVNYLYPLNKVACPVYIHP